MKPIFVSHGVSADCSTWTREGQQTLVPPKFIVVNTSGSYRFYDAPTNYRTQYMYKGLEYDGVGLYKLTDSSGTALSAGTAYVVF